MKKIVKIISGALLVCLFVLSLALIFNRQIKTYLIKSYQPKVTRDAVVKSEKLQRQASNSNAKRKSPRANQKSHGVSYDFGGVKSLDLQTTTRARLKKNAVQVVGQILVPKSKIHLPIGLGVSNNTLALAAGTMRPDQKMGVGNYPLAGHHMINHDVLFGPLYYRTKVGENLYLTDMKNVFKYKIYEKKFISAYKVSVVNQTKKKIITLVTCDKTGTNRLMVRGSYVGKQKLSDVSAKIKQAFERPVNS
ncbi:class A sortase [Lentilactobacillus sp. Marseille-Q4993]|uniref:class A sortase n=1 Tax=Lentilactobacillus sp. Marseille-Q4993 TaxID=3039492 RepID=UPI0024BD129A|nr:class A sortase [Lentilactobacillus sp. Marseille-Q4993]